MPTLTLRKDEMGQLAGLTEKDARAWRRWQKRVADLAVGGTVGFTFRWPRSPKFHGRHFAILNRIFDRQESFVDPDIFRKWGEMGGGHCDWVPGPDGVMQPIPKSIDYLSLDDDEFREVHTAVMAFLRTQHALQVLWPYRPWQQSWEAVDNWIEAGR
jgi:hypothetical protein